MSDYTMLKPVQDRLKEILSDFDILCKQIGVTYFLAYGSLLGAARHKDVIPWDDDIDVVVPRNEYQKLIEYFQRNEMRDYKLAAYEIDRSLALYAKFVRCDNRNADLRKYYTHPDGMCIDVFPLDEAYPRDNWKQVINEIRIRAMKRAVSSKEKLNDRNFKESALKRIVRRIFVIPYLPFQNSWLISRAISLCKKYNGKKAPDLVFYGTIKPMKNEHNKRESWLPGKELPFGNKMYPVAQDYKAVLTVYYGPKYYEMPPDYLRYQHGEATTSGWGD